MLLASAPPLVRHLHLHVAGWPSGAPPMRIALLSDLHVATPTDSPRHLAHVVETINASHPDLVLIAGDFLSSGTLFVHAADEKDATAPLAGLRAPLGVVGVLGNHDYEFASKLIPQLARAHVTLLRNQSLRKGPVTIVGLENYETVDPVPALSLTRNGRFAGVPIVLTHSPDFAPHLPSRIHLMLAGHTHCGQIAPWPIGPVLTESLYGRRYACKLIREGGLLTLVTAGLGTSNLPFRLGARPDIWMIDLGR